MTREHHQPHYESQPVRRPAGEAKIVVDCNALKPSGEQLVRLQHVARTAGLEAECGSVKNRVNAELVVEGYTLPAVQHVLRNPQMVVDRNGIPRTDRDGRVRIEIDDRALKSALEHGERSFSLFAMGSGVAMEASRITGMPFLPVTVTKPRLRECNNSWLGHLKHAHMVAASSAGTPYPCAGPMSYPNVNYCRCAGCVRPNQRDRRQGPC